MSMAAVHRRYEQALEWLVIALMAVLAIEVTTGVAFRSAGYSLAWYDEVASILLAWLTFYGSALASVKRAHIGCPELVATLPWPARRAANIVAQLLVIAFFALLGGVGIWITPILATDAMVSIPSIPMSVVQSVIPIAAALIVVAEITHLIDLITAREPAAPAGDLSLSKGMQ